MHLAFQSSPHPSGFARRLALGCAAALLVFSGSVLSGCVTTTTEVAGPEPAGPAGLPGLEISPITPRNPRPESGGVARVPVFAWEIPGRKNRVDTQIFNLFRASELAAGRDADFIRVFDGPVEQFSLNQGQEGMPSLGLGKLEPNTDYVWRLTITTVENKVFTGEWRFRTGAE